MALKTDPAQGALTITPDDDTDLIQQTTGIYVGVSGNVAVITSRGESVIFLNAAQGSILPVQATRVLDTGTTATGLLGLYTIANGVMS